MRIAILSRNKELYSTKRLVEAAKKRGHEVRVFDHTKLYMVNESGAANLYYGNEKVEDYDAVIPRIGASVTFYGAAIIRQFEVQKIFCTVKSVALTR